MNWKNRIANLRQALVEKNIDAILISQPENRYYLSGFRGSNGYLVITAKDAVLATDFRYIEQAKSQAPDYDIFHITNDITNWFPTMISELNLKMLGFEERSITVATHRQLKEATKQTKFKLIPVSGVVESLRIIKEPEEIEFISKAIDISDNAVSHILEVAHVGMTEAEIAWELEKYLRENGSENLPFDVIVASGPNSALPHARPSERIINSGEPVIIDMGARCNGYSSDLSRTMCLGTPNDTFNRVYDTVLGAQLSALAIIQEGMSGSEADSIARGIIDEAGYGNAFGHALGHGIGLAPHESPRLDPNSVEKLLSGMVFTVEPGIYLNGWGGVRIEDVVLMENSGVKVLSKAKKERK